MELLQKLRNMYVASGDLAAVALANGGAKEVRLESLGGLLYIGGRFDFDPTDYVDGVWRLRRRRFAVVLPLASRGRWGAGRTYVEVGERIEVAVDGEVWLSRPNICYGTEDAGGDKHVVVHIVGTVATVSGERYTAFRCSEWILPLLKEPVFDRFAFDKRGVRNEVTGLPVEFVDVFVKRGHVVKVLVNPSCGEYVEAVRRLYGVEEGCRQ
jgi:hypothetical protein